MQEFRRLERASFSDWTKEQSEVIGHPVESRLLVLAGPGTGKTAVACGRIANLIEELDVAPTRILLVSFTRTAVAELRSRIRVLLEDRYAAASVRISTIDSQAWHLRTGFDDEESKKELRNAGLEFESNLQGLISLLEQRDEGLLDFMSKIEHLVVDEAQDVMGVRAELMSKIVGSLSGTCGVTVFADPAQAIYGFTSDYDTEAKNPTDGCFLEMLRSNQCGEFQENELTRIFRCSNQKLVDLFYSSRRRVLAESPKDASHTLAVRRCIQSEAPKTRTGSELDDLAGKDESLVLYRRRVEVLMASSFLAGSGIAHRLRMSRLPPIVFPWIGHLLSGQVGTLLTRSEFDHVWEHRFREKLFGKLERDDGWRLLRRIAGKNDRIDLDRLRDVLSRSRPPIDVCAPECGRFGPIIGTIHGSKGREADNVHLMLPPERKVTDGNETTGPKPHQRDWQEESRVYYVGATRARHDLEVGTGYSFGASSLDGSSRTYRHLHSTGGSSKIQLQVGLVGDVDTVQHGRWNDAVSVQAQLAAFSGTPRKLRATSSKQSDYQYRLHCNDSDQAIGQLSPGVKNDLFELARISGSNLRPPTKLEHIYWVDVTTVVISEAEAELAQAPYKDSRIYLAPVVAGFTVAYFSKGRRGRR